MENVIVLCVLWAFLAPILMAALSYLAGKDKTLRNITLISIPVMVLCDMVYLRYIYNKLPGSLYMSTAHHIKQTIWNMGNGLSLSISIEPMGIMFALLSAMLWLPNMVYAVGYMDKNNEKNQQRFFVLLSLAMTCVMGIAFSGNMITLLFFYEVMTILTYLLVTHNETSGAIKGGSKYIMQLMAPTIFFIILIALTYNEMGRVDFVSFGLFSKQSFNKLGWVALALCGYGVTKAALVPFHGWLPAAMVAPTPVSAFLHAVAVVKAGVFTIIKISVYIFGISNMRSTIMGDGSLFATNLLQIIACATMLFSVARALQNTEIKKILAYSTAANLAYIVGALSTLSDIGLSAALFHMAAHGCGKITLFFAAGAIYTMTHKTSYTQINGLARSMPITMACFSIAAASMMGMPLTSGYLSKINLLVSAAHTMDILFMLTIIVSSVATAVYMIRIIIHAYSSQPGQSAVTISEAPYSMTIPMLCTTGATIALYFSQGWFWLS